MRQGYNGYYRMNLRLVHTETVEEKSIMVCDACRELQLAEAHAAGWVVRPTRGRDVFIPIWRRRSGEE